MDYELPFVVSLLKRLTEKHSLIQVVLGPRQVGKTTGIRQMLEKLNTNYIYESADGSIASPTSWLGEQWQLARAKGPETVLVLDEIQKIENWSESVKKFWDQDVREGTGIKVVLLGSSSLQLQEGLTESLAGRFEITRVPHWNYSESSKAFGCDFETYLQYGGYPGTWQFIEDKDRWYHYVRDAIVEAVIGKDILNSTRVERPALFRQAFELLCHYPAQEISYTKLLGQIQDRGNTDLIKRYIQLLEGAFLFRSLEKFSGKAVKRKSSSPKILPLCPALVTLQSRKDLTTDREQRGRIFELVVGATLTRLSGNLYYWREGTAEIDYIYQEGQKLFAIEVKSGRKKSQKGLDEFRKKFPKARMAIISPENYLEFEIDTLKYLEKVAF